MFTLELIFRMIIFVFILLCSFFLFLTVGQDSEDEKCLEHKVQSHLNALELEGIEVTENDVIVATQTARLAYESFSGSHIKTDKELRKLFIQRVGGGK